jgi:hypothetical protein
MILVENFMSDELQNLRNILKHVNDRPKKSTLRKVIEQIWKKFSHPVSDKTQTRNFRLA